MECLIRCFSGLVRISGSGKDDASSIHLVRGFVPYKPPESSVIVITAKVLELRRNNCRWADLPTAYLLAPGQHVFHRSLGCRPGKNNSEASCSKDAEKAHRRILSSSPGAAVSKGRGIRYPPPYL